MKVIVAGGRDFIPFTIHFDWLKDKLKELNATEEVSGCARGADTFGEQVASILYIPIKKFPPEWDIYGRSAGYRRNVEMANYADAVILFPGGKGTAHMKKIAEQKNLKVIEYEGG